MPIRLEDMKRYVGFTAADAEALRGLATALAPRLPEVAQRFHERILADPRTRRLLEGSEVGLGRHRQLLIEWLTSGLRGPHDEALFERRQRIGRAHVRIGLGLQYMLTSMNGLRRDLRALIEALYADDAPARRAAGDAVDRLLDLELAMMLHSYREDSEDRARRHERLAVTGRIAALIGHELREPLTVIETSLHMLRRRCGQPDAERHLDRMQHQVRVSAGIITDLLEMTRNEPPSRTQSRVQALFDEAVAGVRLPPNVQLEVAPTDLSLAVEPNLVVRALVNLLQNAVAALAVTGGHIRFEAASEPGTVCLSVGDDGPGFDPDVLARAFEPLVTTRSQGTGLGLALVRRVCERHGGTAEARNQATGGARVTMRLPA
jgi:signal transduction histidine kinase